MDDAVLDRIEHTVLGPATTPADVRAVLDAAAAYGMRACLPPCYLDVAADHASDVPVTTVVGFPHGQHTTETKRTEATAAVRAGAAEVDVVANLGLLRADPGAYEADIAAVAAAVSVPVKVIVQAPRLPEADLRRAAELAASADADYLKTATGFGDGGATVGDVSLLAEFLPVKAAGGIATWADTQAMFDAGADRIGTSSGDAIATEYRAERGGVPDDE